jgi:FixJ family two-component response regulator
MPEQHEIVLVDDDAAVLSALKFAFEVDGFVVRVFANAESLLAEPETPDPGCLVVDQVLPGMSGLELLRRLRGRGVLAPAVLISTPTPRVKALAANDGVQLVAKPLLSNELVEEVRRQIATR